MGVVAWQDVAEMCSNSTGIPVGSLDGKEQLHLMSMEARLSQKILGQEKAISKVCACIRRSRAGIRAKGRPSAVLMFLGTTGVGKTELAKALAVELGYGSSLIRMDMTEYKEKHSVSKLIGSPPGYVGHEGGGMLVEKVRRNPYSVVLFDEVDKACDDVRDLLLTIMDEGRLTDSQGREADFTNTIIIMTANHSKDACGSIGFGEAQESKYRLGAGFSKEFIARIDEVIIFETPTEATLNNIARLRLSELKARLAEEGYHVEFSEELSSTIAMESYGRHQGARPVAEIMRTMVENPLADLILSGRNIGETITFPLQEEEVKIAVKN